MNHARFRVALCAALFLSGNAHAFGINDLISIGVQAGGEVLRAAGSKAVDAVKESMRDPEAEAREKAEKERKLAEQMQKQIDEIEAMPNLRPIDRERLVLQLKEQYKATKEMQAFVERAEAQQKAERDKVLTFGGIAGVVGRAALNTPSMVVAQADAQVAAGIPQAKARLATAQADALMKTGLLQAVAGEIANNAEDLSRAKQAAIDAARAANSASQGEAAAMQPQTANAGGGNGGEAAPQATDPQAASLDAFSPDLGKKVWIEFEDAPVETASLRKRLQERGHIVVNAREEAEVAYLIQGEFTIPETKMHDGLTKSVGALLENPDQSIEPPAKKTMGAIGAGLSRFMLAAAGAQAPQEHGFRQEALLVIARQPKDGKETRVSVVQKAQGETIEAVKLAKGARDEIYRVLGL